MKDISQRDHRAGEASDLHVAIVVSSYHEEVTGGLTRGARDALETLGAPEAAVQVVRVPGAFELPLAARRAAETGRFDAVICLGCVIRGETPHFDYIASAVAHGVTTAAQATGVPISFGVLTTNTIEEARARAGDGADNKGREAALAAVDLARALQELDT